MLNIGVVGYGYWGPNLVRNFAESARMRVAAVADLDARRLALVQARYPAVRTTTQPSDLLADASIDAVAIATPVSSHFELARAALRAGKHVLVEKPLTASSDEARRLMDEAAARNRVLMVDHTFVYTGAVQTIRRLLSGGEMGDLYYYDSVRVNLGLFQRDVSVIWDLAVHDLAILDYIVPARPVAVSATGTHHVPGHRENIAYLTLFFDGSLIAHLHVNWLAPVKVRRTLIGGSRKMIVYDDLEPSEKVKVYDRGVVVQDSPESVYQMLVGYRTGDMWAPQVGVAEALRSEVEHFADCILEGRPPDTDGGCGLRVVRVLECACKSVEQRGAPVSLGSG
jgi:predicted dehydrogenase